MAQANRTMTREELIRLWEDPTHWRGGLYRCPEDPRVVVPKRITWGGWTVNFAHPMAWPMILWSVVIAVGPIMLLLALGVKDVRWLVGAIVLSIAVLIVESYYLSGRTHPEAVPKVILAVLVVMGFGMWACHHGMPWLPALVLLGWLLFFVIFRWKKSA